MATVTDEQVNLGSGFTGTNLNAFMFGFLPLNDAYGYGGVNSFGDSDTAITTIFTQTNADSVGGYILSQEGDNILSQDGSTLLAYLGSLLNTFDTVSGATSLSDEEVSGSVNISDEDTDGG
jgi:hypothetical protein